MGIAENYHKIKKSLPGHVTVISVIKTRGPEEVRELIDAGARDFGGNYVQETASLKKSISPNPEIKWHMIGHLQTNKAGEAVKLFTMIQSIDSIKIAAKLQKRLEQYDLYMPSLVEINIGRERGKTGVFPENALQLCKEIINFSRIKFSGLMCMEPYTPDSEQPAVFFRQMRELYNKIQDELANPNFSILSMGMSHSYMQAVENGSNMVRLGTAIFGVRPPKTP